MYLNGRQGWAYIAGFFDGEGYMGLTKRASARLSLVQKGSSDGVIGRKCLTLIREFLKAEGSGRNGGRNCTQPSQS